MSAVNVSKLNANCIFHFLMGYLRYFSLVLGVKFWIQEICLCHSLASLKINQNKSDQTNYWLVPSLLLATTFESKHISLSNVQCPCNPNNEWEFTASLQTHEEQTA